MGECLVDLLANKADKQDLNEPTTYSQYAGGAPANVAVAVAKLGGKSTLISKVGGDKFGTFLLESLRKYDVRTDYVRVINNAQTALAFVFLDEQGERYFEFYNGNAAQLTMSIDDYPESLFEQGAIVALSSTMFSNSKLEESTQSVLNCFKRQLGLILLDINYRAAFWDEPHRAAAVIDSHVKQVDVIKASKEELIELYGINKIDAKIADWLANGVSLVLITDGNNGVSFNTTKFDGAYPTPSVQALDTTAAGDAFVGGFLYQISQQIDGLHSFKEWVACFDNVLKAIDYATKCGAFAVTRYGAFASLPNKSDILTVENN